MQMKNKLNEMQRMQLSYQNESVKTIRLIYLSIQP